VTADLNQLELPTFFQRVVDSRALASLIESARDEDLATRGDITSELCIAEQHEAAGRIRARHQGILAGMPVAARVAKAYDPALVFTPRLQDGQAIGPDTVVAELAGPLRAMLAAERVLLNFLTHLSGIATLTARYVDAVAATSARIYDTRKTIPGFRGLAKYAVRCGGGLCHRMGLHDAVLIKDNHLADAGHELVAAIEHAIEQARRLSPVPAFVEVEVDSLDQLQLILPLGPHIVLLDNMTSHELERAVALRNDIAPDVQLEASGGVSLDAVGAIAAAGVDRIAVGAITHSAAALDLGLDITETR